MLSYAKAGGILLIDKANYAQFEGKESLPKLGAILLKETPIEKGKVVAYKPIAIYNLYDQYLRFDGPFARSGNEVTLTLEAGGCAVLEFKEKS